MIGAALSRWTMAFFAAALVCLLGAQVLMVAGYGYPAMTVEAPETLVLAHVVTIGWLSLLMIGALFQFVPVLVAKPLRSVHLVLPALLCLLVGLACLIAGFLQLSGVLETRHQPLTIAGILLPAGFAAVFIALAMTLWSARPLQLPARFVAVGLACLAATALLGVVFSLVRAGLVQAPLFLDLHGVGIPLHAAAGFGGWLTFTAIGVSYRLLPMFMLSPDGERPTTRIVLWSGSAALVLVILVAPIELLAAGTGFSLIGASLAGLVALCAYGFDLVYFYRNRKRRQIELNSKAALGAFACLCLSALLLLWTWASGRMVEHAGPLVYLVAFGWLTGLGLSQLYKIVPFLTWLECYGPVMGRQPTPRVQDLVVERRGGRWFVLYFLGVAVATGALLAGDADIFRLASVATLAAIAGIVIELVIARRLANVAAGMRLPQGSARPRLFLPPRTVKIEIGATG